jgi:gliding motility-associated-like protein
MIRFSFFFFLLLSTTLAFAQPYTSRLGRFRVDERKGCAPLTVTFETLLPGGCGANPCIIDFLGDGFTQPADSRNTSPASFTYTTPGIYLLKVCYSNQCAANEVDDIQIEVVANLQPDFDLFTCNGNGVQVKINDNVYNQYVINYSDGTSTTVPSGSLAKDNHVFATAGAKTVSVRGRNLNAADNCATLQKNIIAVAAVAPGNFNSLTAINESEIDLRYTLPVNTLSRIDIALNNASTFQQLKFTFEDNRDTVSNLSNNSAYYCYRISSIDACTNTAANTSPIICSVRLNASAQDGFNRLDWIGNNTGVTAYSVGRDDQAGYFGGISPALTTINDTESICNEEHCYQLTANYAGGVTSTSLVKCVESFTNQQPPALTDITASINDNEEAELIWTDAPEATVYYMYKNTNGGAYAFIETDTQSPFTDTAIELASNACYQILYDDACENKSNLSPEACHVVLSANLSTDNAVNLSWTAYQGWANGIIGYRLEKYSQSGGLLRVFNVGNVNTFTDTEVDLFNQQTYYRIFVLPNDGALSAATSNRLEVIRRPNLFYPRAFTPDDQGPVENEIFRVFGQYISSFEMKIFNRWGELVFTSNSIDQGWDGTFRGVDQPDGTYAFVSNITDFAGRTFTESGAVVLMRKK